MTTIYRNRGRWIWSTWAFSMPLPRILDPLWRWLAARPATLKIDGRK